MKFPNENEIKKLREKYPVGAIIKVLSMDDPYNPVPSGTLGEVISVDDAGNIRMKWQTGSSLGLIEGVDSFTIVDGVKTICYGEEILWEFRKDAVAFFLKGMAASEGSERQRYSNIYLKLIMGAKICDDSE